MRPNRLLKSAVRTLTLASGLVILNLIPFLRAEPPFGGTIFLDPDIITKSDPTAWQDLEYAGRGNRSMYDRRTGSFLNLHAFECEHGN